MVRINSSMALRCVKVIFQLKLGNHNKNVCAFLFTSLENNNKIITYETTFASFLLHAHNLTRKWTFVFVRLFAYMIMLPDQPQNKMLLISLTIMLYSSIKSGRKRKRILSIKSGRSVTVSSNTLNLFQQLLSVVKQANSKTYSVSSNHTLHKTPISYVSIFEAPALIGPSCNKNSNLDTN